MNPPQFGHSEAYFEILISRINRLTSPPAYLSPGSATDIDSNDPQHANSLPLLLGCELLEGGAFVLWDDWV